MSGHCPACLGRAARADLRRLPRRVRLRLRWDRFVNNAGIWLVEHEHFRAAKVLWGIREGGGR